MQPPPRKIKHSVALKNVHTEQLSKLQQKHQQEIDLLEDIRLFSKQRAAIEKEYAQSLCKLAQQFLHKRQFPAPPSAESGKDLKTGLCVWKTVLEETDRVGKARLEASDVYQQQISDTAKPLRTSKQQTSKKVFEQLRNMQVEVAQSVHDMNKSQKVYQEDEHISHEARVKASEAEERLNKKSTGLFTSLSTLQKNSAKLIARRDTCEVKSCASRNEYLLNLAAANAHHSKYFEIDLPSVFQILDKEMYEKVKDFFTSLAMQELQCCGTTQECFTKILADSNKISKEYNQQCFLKENKVFTDTLQYKFEPQDNDPQLKVSKAHNAELTLNKEARKWATKIAKENRAITENMRQTQQIQEQIATGGKMSPGSQEGAPSSTAELEAKLDELKVALRRHETGKTKAEAKIECLREAGTDVDEWLNSANAEVLANEEEDTSQHSGASERTDSSNYRKSSANDGFRESSTSSIPSMPNETTYINYEEDDYVDDTFDSSQDVTPRKAGGSSSTGYSSGRSYPIPCTALYDFQANNADELSLKENEPMELISDGDGDGWVKARNAEGKVGLIPENYINFTDYSEGVSVDAPDSYPDQDLSSSGVDSAPPSAGLSDNTSTAPSSAGVPAERTSAYSASDFEVQQTVLGTSPEDVWARALYDYEATSPEELTFQEGQLIRLLRKDENGVDDGWWEGEVNGKRGVFPSLVVEEIVSKAKLGPQDLESPMRAGPPPFTPPEPGPPVPHLEITRATPSDDGGASASNDDIGVESPGTSSDSSCHEPLDVAADFTEPASYTDRQEAHDVAGDFPQPASYTDRQEAHDVAGDFTEPASYTDRQEAHDVAGDLPEAASDAPVIPEVDRKETEVAERSVDQVEPPVSSEPLIEFTTNGDVTSTECTVQPIPAEQCIVTAQVHAEDDTASADSSISPKAVVPIVPEMTNGSDVDGQPMVNTDTADLRIQYDDNSESII